MPVPMREGSVVGKRPVLPVKDEQLRATIQKRELIRAYHLRSTTNHINQLSRISQARIVPQRIGPTLRHDQRYRNTWAQDIFRVQKMSNSKEETGEMVTQNELIRQMMNLGMI